MLRHLSLCMVPPEVGAEEGLNVACKGENRTDSYARLSRDMVREDELAEGIHLTRACEIELKQLASLGRLRAVL